MISNPWRMFRTFDSELEAAWYLKNKDIRGALSLEEFVILKLREEQSQGEIISQLGEHGIGENDARGYVTRKAAELSEHPIRQERDKTSALIVIAVAVFVMSLGYHVGLLREGGLLLFCGVLLIVGITLWWRGQS